MEEFRFRGESGLPTYSWLAVLWGSGLRYGPRAKLLALEGVSSALVYNQLADGLLSNDSPLTGNILSDNLRFSLECLYVLFQLIPRPGCGYIQAIIQAYTT